MSNYSVRRAGLADAAAIDALTQDAYAKWVPVIGRKPRPMTIDYAQAAVDHRIDLIELDGRLAALIELALEPDHVMIVSLAVAPDYQGRGLGSVMLCHAEEVASELDLDTLRLYTNALMAENIALYGRRGYVLERQEPFAGGTAIHMIKRLAIR